MGLTREQRLAMHMTQKRTQVKDGVPNANELSEGVSTLRKTPEGIVEYVKYKNVIYKKKLVSENETEDEGITIEF